MSHVFHLNISYSILKLFLRVYRLISLKNEVLIGDVTHAQPQGKYFWGVFGDYVSKFFKLFWNILCIEQDFYKKLPGALLFAELLIRNFMNLKALNLVASMAPKYLKWTGVFWCSFLKKKIYCRVYKKDKLHIWSAEAQNRCESNPSRT